MKQKDKADLLKRLERVEQIAKSGDERKLKRFFENAPTELLRRLADDEPGKITEEEFQEAFLKYSR